MEEVTILGGGCFWCLEAVYERLDGVTRVQSGYAGGATANPTYQQVCGGTTGHAEVVQVHFDPDRISFREILEVFFAIHDPTTLNRQGPDTGTQYRSIILFHTPDQETVAKQTIAELNAADIWDTPIVTEVVSSETFYPAEEYHQGFYGRNPSQPYCNLVIDPKVAKFRERFRHRLKQEATG